MKIKKYTYNLFFTLSCTLLILCCFLKFNTYNFNSNNVINNTKYLSSNKFLGRLPGSDGNNSAANEIAAAFKEYGLKPLSDSYLQNFYVKAPVKTSEKISLNILNDKGIVKEFKVGVDFKEDMLNFKTTNISFSNMDTIEIGPRSIIINKDNKSYLFAITFDKDFSFRSSFYKDSFYDFIIQINTNTFNEILNSLRNGYILNINLPYKIKDTGVSNVAAIIKGTDKSLSPLVFTAHFDHLGVDSLGNVYGGALDNASGTAFLLELAKTYSKMKPPKRDIIFVSLNAEEFGLLGSLEFLNKNKDILYNSEIINFDMIGADKNSLSFILGTCCNNRESNLLNDIKYYSGSSNIAYNVAYEDSSDHASFNNNGIDALTICHSDTTNIHTPKDTYEKLSTDSIEDVYNIIEKKTFDYAYYDFVLLLYSPYTLGALLIIFILLLSAKIYPRKNK